MKLKTWMSVLLTICMIFSVASAFADTTDYITVNVSIAKDGQFVTGKNGFKIAHTPIPVTDRNNDGSYDMEEVLYAAHESCYAGGAESGYASAETEYGQSLTKLWGVENVAFGYYKDNQPAMSLADPVANGNSVYAFIYQDQDNWSDTYTYFDDDTIAAVKEQRISVKLNKLGWNENGMPVASPVANATITIDGSSTEYKTNEDGVAEITFAHTGIYTLSAVTAYTITPPICIVNVTENGSTEPTPPTDDKDDTEKSDTPTDTEKKDYAIVIPDALEKIAATYIEKDAWSDWIVMDMGAYANYAPETQSKMTEDAKQKYINSAIQIIQDAPSDTDIAKAVLGLVAIRKDPALLYSVNSNIAISAIEKLNDVPKSTSPWSAPYTLAAYNQGDYATNNYETKMIDTLLAHQEENGSWNEYGTIDTTANVIAGLSFYKDKPKVRDAIDKAINYLSTQQNPDGTFSDSFSGANANSTAMVVIGLSAAGVDLINDTRFIQNENTIIDGLLSFLVADGNGFGHTNNESINPGATEQAFRALIAIMQTTATGEAYNIYDFSKNERTPARATGSSTSSSTPSAPTGQMITVTLTIKADTGYWLKKYKVRLPGDDATVYDAFVMACKDNSIAHIGAASGYVSSMTNGSKTLAEFDKGENSGWLYKVNGELPTVGLTDCRIADGDTIVWYYTKDWARDPSASRDSSAASISVPIDEPKEEIKDTLPTIEIQQYTDVPVDAWYYHDIKKAMEIDLLHGISDHTFAPDMGVTRGMLVTVLYRYAGEKGFQNSIHFTDCDAHAWYSDAVCWASENHIVSGYGNGIFGPDDSVTRQQLVTILYRYAGTKTQADCSEFADAEEIEDWAKDAMMWAVANKIICGTDQNALNPNGYATRAELATIFMRYIYTLAE
ncbi:MAG: S-layer homology domain-containing protein [Clostridia bacterium]|nr:S-layer homology domain-containing protein [Clostridia bacterium]